MNVAGSVRTREDEWLLRVNYYTVLVHEAEEGGYRAEAAELPGCVSQGETRAELRPNIREAIEAVLGVMAEDGTPPPTIRKWKVPSADARLASRPLAC